MRYATLALALPVLVGLSASSAHAQFLITPTFDSTWSTDLNASADEATITNLLTNTYDANFTNNVNVTIDFSNVTYGLGTSTTGVYGVDYTSYVNSLASDKSAAQGGDGNTAFLSDIPASSPVAGITTVGVSSAQGRMLGYNTPGIVTITGDPLATGKYDSQVALFVGLTGPAVYDSNGQYVRGGYSLAGVASHEIDEVLGMSSGLNSYNQGANASAPTTISGEDLFRYSAPGVRSFTNDPNVKSYYSDDGGKTVGTYFNQQAGADYQDWASHGDAVDGAGVDGPPQVQDAYSTPTTTSSTATTALGVNEFKALNDIGYNRANGLPSAAPEPSQFASLGLAAFSVLGLILKAKKGKKTQKRVNFFLIPA